MKKLEEFIYSVKYLAPTLYFGSVGLLGYDIYSNVLMETEFLNSYIQLPLTIIFFYISYLGLKKYQKK